MGKVKFSAFIVDIRNKVGGSVFSRNSAGAYVRNKVTPINPQSVAQQAVRNQFAFLSQNWRALTPGQRQSFNDAVGSFLRTDIFGDAVSPTGLQLYQRLNRNLQAAGQAVVTTPPTPGTVFTFDTFTVIAATGLGTMEATFTLAIPAGTSIVVRATPPQSAGKNFFKSEYRQITVLDNADISPFDLATAYTAAFGVLPPVGMKVSIAVHSVVNASGLNSAELSAQDIAV